MSSKDTLNKAYGNMPKEVGFSDQLFDWLPTFRGVKYVWYKWIIRKIFR